MRTAVSSLVILTVSYAILILPFATHMKQKAFVEKLGYVPQPEVISLVSGDQRQVIAASLVLKVLIYFGSLVEKSTRKITIPPDYPGMTRTIHAAVKLDPYNMDAYYFAQAILAWDLGQITKANNLLEFGMRYRTWDFYLPLFAGFNYAYFLKDFTKAAQYYQRAGELTGDQLYVNLAGRYLYEAGETDHAIAFLSAMEKGARNDSIRKSFQTRLKALGEVKKVEEALEHYIEAKGTHPTSIDQLLKEGYLEKPPVDPYGGAFYIDESGKVRSTSKFAFGSKQ